MHCPLRTQPSQMRRPRSKSWLQRIAPNGQPIPCVPGQPCLQSPYGQQNSAQPQLSQAQQQAQQLAAKERELTYIQRWKIETFHKILKSGCRAEASKLRTAERPVNFLSILCILGWRIFWLTMINRSVPNASPNLAFTSLELRLLDQLVKEKKHQNSPTYPLSMYLIKLARLGGYLARTHDPRQATWSSGEVSRA
jgi:hypothetical protein